MDGFCVASPFRSRPNARAATLRMHESGSEASEHQSRQDVSTRVGQSGGALFRQDCSFCHGRDAGGGESGPDLTRSKLVTADVDGDKIGPVVRNGRPDKGMPRFDLTDQQIAG